MTFNIGNGLVLPDRLGEHLRSLDLDVIGLQEVSAAQQDALIRDTSESHPHQVLSGAGFHGRGLLSRYPIVKHEWIEVSQGRPDLLTVLDVAGHLITVLVGHPMPPRLGRTGVVFNATSQNQIAGFADLITGQPPGILLADMNMTARNPMYITMVEAGLIDAHVAAGSGSGLTFPLRPGYMRRIAHPFTWVPLPAFSRIDYIWHTPELTTEAVWLGSPIGSDHRPVVARLRLPELSSPPKERS